MITVRAPGANIYHTYLFSTLKDSKGTKASKLTCFWPESLSSMHIWYVKRHATECTVLLWKAYRGNLINLPKRFPTYNRVFESKTNRNSFCLTQGLTWILLHCGFKFIIHSLLYFYNQWRMGTLLSTWFH